ncbi:hypothetical protein DHX103_07200 [Planococcus sp. X10-3]|uniref:hypothetical protein n=1 Tax=Planococcus sp. X10-3 TaxID=3061240 RepID=UPI003BB15383
MNKDYLRFSYAISAISVIIGLLLIFNSVSRGQALASAEINRQFGSMDTDQYNMVFEAGINQFLVLGGIFAGSGLLIAVLLSYTLLLRSKRDLEEEDVHV